MQKIDLLALGFLFFTISFANAQTVDTATSAKIKAWVKAEVLAQLGPVPATPNGSPLDSEINAINVRLGILEKTADYYSGYKREIFAKVMMSYQGEVLKACCPLQPNKAILGKSWFRPRQGRNKGKPKRSRQDQND